MFKKLIFGAFLMGLVFLVCGSLLFAGNDPEDMSKLPNFKEEEIISRVGLVRPDSRILFSFKNELVLYETGTKPGRYLFLDTDGKITREIKADFEGTGSIFTLDPADRLYVLAQQMTRDSKSGQIKESALKLYIYDTKGRKIRTQDLGKVTPVDGNAFFVGSIAADSKGQIYMLRYGKNVTMMNVKGKTVKTLGPEGCRALAVDNADKLLLAVDGFLLKLDPMTGKVEWRAELVNNFARDLFYNRKDLCAYILDTRGVRCYNMDGKFTGYELDLRPHSIMDIGIYINHLALDVKKNFYISAVRYNDKDESQNLLYKYSPEKSKTKSQQVLTVGGCKSWDERFFSVAANRFQQANRDWSVQISYEDNLKLNTELMAGKGPDVILFADYEPYRKYIDKGMLVDLDSLISGDKGFHREEYFANILDGCRLGEKMYLMPLSVNFDSILVNPAVLQQKGLKINDREWTWQDFYKMAEQVTRDLDGDGSSDCYALPKYGAGLMHYCFRDCIDGFMDEENKKAFYATPEFSDLLRRFKILADKCQNPQYDYSGNTFTMPDDEIRRSSGLLAGEIIFSMERVSGMYEVMGVRDETLEYLFPPRARSGGDGGVRFHANILCGINRQSKNKDQAWEFLKLLLSEPLQSSQEQIYIPVHQKAFTIKAENGTRNLPPSRLESSPEKNIAVVRRFISAATKMYRPGNGEVTGIVWDEANKYVAGEKSLEDAVKVMQEKANFYLNE